MRSHLPTAMTVGGIAPLRNASRVVASACLAGLMTACGGGGDAPVAAPMATAQGIEAQPVFHRQPVDLPEPADTDADGSAASAQALPDEVLLPAELVGMDTLRLTDQDVVVREAAVQGQVFPAATAAVNRVYTPAQIRAAYSMPALPAAGATVPAATAASLGAGQTLYIVDAYHSPTVVADLAAFNAKFGLPTCKAVAIPATTRLPLAPAPTTGCTISVVSASATGTLSAAIPAYSAGWATEAALDVQWAHAAAPYARIVLIETANASVVNLVGGVTLGNAMGPGVVSMSFGAAEGAWTPTYDAVFQGTNMTYVASSGDGGAGVNWPAVSGNVLAVGGTSLNYSGTGVRSETAWSRSGGGLSAYVPLPVFQSLTPVPLLGGRKVRGVADVGYNADPATGHYVAFTASGTTPSWYSVGGTSAGAPQWAGLVAVANAQRALAGKAPLGLTQNALYGRIAAAKTTYQSAFADVTSGANGSCATCQAGVGYDTPTGLGTPNVTNLLGQLSAY